VFHAALIEAFGSCHNSLRSLRHLLEHRTILQGQQHAISGADDESSVHQRKEYLATCIPGLATYLEEELEECGVSDTQVLSEAAVSFSTHDESTALKVLLWTRTAHRILEQIDTFSGVETRADVYDAVKHSRMPVKDLLGDGHGGLLSLSVKVIANGRLPKDISHSHYTALTIKNALVDQVRDLKGGDRPDVELEDPDVPLVAILHSQGMSADMTLYRSLAPPGSLHRRGYRSGGAIHKAGTCQSCSM
jgi:23S rRNA G2445 N2-methylase RlmL